MTLSMIVFVLPVLTGLVAETESVSPPLPAGYRVLVEENFDADPRGWGTVKLANGAVLVDGEVLLPVSTLSDAVIDYRACVNGEGILNLRFRYDLDNYLFYMFRLDTRSSGGNPPGFLKRDPTERWWHICGERLLDESPTPGQWVQVRLVLSGPRFEAFVNGRLAATFEDRDYASGFLVFNNELTQAQVDWVRVAVPEDSPAAPLGISKPAPAPSEPFAQGEWTAEWIWLPAAQDSLVVFFRREFELPSDPAEALLAITCDNRYEVWLNNRRVGSDGDWYSAETYDVTAFLNRGRNIIAVIGENEAPGAAGLLAELAVNCVDGSYVNIHTDGSWKASQKGPSRWSELDYDDDSWIPARSFGQHPQQPWAGQSALPIPYLGPKQPLRIVATRAPARIRVNEPVEVEVSFMPVQALKHEYLVQILLGKGDAVHRLALLPPATPATRWPVGSVHKETFTVRIRPDVAYVVDYGPCELRVRLLGTFLVGSTPSAKCLLVRGAVQRFVGLRKPNSDGSPVTLGTLADTEGKTYQWRLNPDGSISIAGVPYAVLPGSQGVYFCRLEQGTREALAGLDWPAEARRLCAEGGPLPEDIVRVRLVDHVNCTREDHGFSEDGGLGGKSRVLDIDGRKYRVTAARKRTSYFAYSLTCDSPRNPHLLLFQTPNDRERYTTVRIQPPWDNVGGGVYTGREYPCDNRPVEAMFLFYPREKNIRVTVSSVPCYDDFCELSGAAVSGLWLFELEDALSDRPVTVLSPPERQRKLGMYLTHPAYCYTLYGFPRGPEHLRRASIKSFRDYLAFCGINLFEYNAVDGADTTGTAYHPSKLWQGDESNLLAELLTYIAPNGVDIVPIVTSLSVPEGKLGFTRDSFQIDRFGNFTYFFNTRPPLPDPLRPEVKKVLLDSLREILDICAANPAVPAVGFRVNGKIGLCYGGSELHKSDQYTGYSQWDVEQFRRATGIAVPEGLKPTAYQWIRDNCWEEWLRWRCEETAKLWRSARDLVRSYRRDLLLLASCDMPSETPAWNIYWPSGISPMDCMIFHGVDPHMFRGEEGIVLQRGMMVSADRYFTGHGQYDQNHWAHKAFHYAPGVSDMYEGPHGTWCELYHNYWEEFGIFPQGEFGTNFWGAATMTPWGRYFFEPIAFSIYATNAYAINLFSWERGTFAHEHSLRSFARAFRALPAERGQDATQYVQLVTPVTIKPSGTRASREPQPPSAPEGEGVWARWFPGAPSAESGARLALCNFSPVPITVRITWPNALRQGEQLVEAARMVLLRTGPAKTATFDLSLQPYELRTVIQRTPYSSKD
jgi:hypothetical protein